MGFLIFIIIILLIVNYLFKKEAQLAYITTYKYNASIRAKLTEKYTHLSDSDIDRVFESLTDFFYCCNQANQGMVSMPSQVVDVAWHEFILFTKEYETFSENAFERFLHHTPTEAMDSKTTAQEGIKRAWRLACSREKINPKEPEYLPRLFAIDSYLNILDGYTYTLNCQDKLSANGNSYCASHIGCAGGCGGGCSGGCGGCGG